MNTQTEAVAIIQTHWNNAWRARLAKRIIEDSGRWTKAKRHDREIAEAVSSELEQIVSELRQAGYTITDS